MRFVARLAILLVVTFSIMLVTLAVASNPWTTRLDCDPAADECVLSRRGLLGTERLPIPAAIIARAEARQRPTQLGNTVPAQLWIVTARGELYFDTFVVGTAADAPVARINAWLGKQDAPLSVVNQDDVLFWLICGGLALDVLLLVGITAILMRPSSNPPQPIPE